MSTTDWDLLRGLSEEDVSAILALATPKFVPERAILFRLGDAAEAVFLLAEGRINLTLPLRLGSEQEEVMVEERSPGQLVGWSGLIHPYRFTLQGVAPEETKLLVLPRAGLLELFSAKPEMGSQVFANLAHLIGQRLQLFQTMWIRGMQRVLESRSV